MKHSLKFLSVLMLGVLSLVVSANAYQDNFSTAKPEWYTLLGTVSRTAFDASLALKLEMSSTVSNSAQGVGTKVWTDFMTIPRRYQSGVETAPAADSSATAQFYVNSEGYWTTISGEGTNVWKKNLLTGLEYAPVSSDPTSYYHVSVLNDYSGKTWSLFVDGYPLATNLLSISQVNKHEWFQIQNLGGGDTNICWLDNFIVSNSVFTVASANDALTNVISGTDIPQVLAFAGFGSFEDPRPVITNATVGPNSATWQFMGAVPGSSYTVLKSSSATSGFIPAGSVFDPDNGVFTGADIGGNVSKYFYRLVRVSDAISVTNTETYAVYKQGRIPGTTYIVGVPVDYVGNDRTLGGPLGTQLASGLSDGDKLTVYPGQKTYTLTTHETYWAGERPLSNLTPGMGVMIEHANGSSPSSTILAGILQTNTSVGTVTLNNGWNIVAWPFETPGSLASFTSGLTASDTSGADYIVFQNVTNATTIARLTVSDGWKTGTRPGSGSTFNPILQPGAGIMLYLHGATGEWHP